MVPDLGNGAHFLQHRGPAYAGLFVFDPALRQAALEKGEGLADDIFKPLGHLSGDVGIAHTRYKTHGEGGINNAQPFFDPMAAMALAHNGHITNVQQIATELAARGQALKSSCDADALLRVLALWVEHLRADDPRMGERQAKVAAIEQVHQRLTGAYSVVVVTPSGLYAFRDPHGFRPMVRGVRTKAGRESVMIAAAPLPPVNRTSGQASPAARRLRRILHILSRHSSRRSSRSTAFYLRGTSWPVNDTA